MSCLSGFPRRALVRAISLMGLASLLSGCAPERWVQIDLVTTPRPGQSVERERIQLVVGQALGIELTAFKNDDPREDWTVEGRSSNVTVFRIEETKQQNIWSVSGVYPGKAEIRFVIDGRFQSFVQVDVRERGDWDPSIEDEEAPPFDPTDPNPPMGGAGGMGGADG
jgi:hypothetical protein